MDLEGIVSKRLGSRYVSGCNQWRRQERQRETDFPWGARHAGIGQVASVRIREWRSAAGEDDQPDETNVIHHSRGFALSGHAKKAQSAGQAGMAAIQDVITELINSASEVVRRY
jgi:ATP-dependent DNA ligase